MTHGVVLTMVSKRLEGMLNFMESEDWSQRLS